MKAILTTLIIFTACHAHAQMAFASSIAENQCRLQKLNNALIAFNASIESEIAEAERINRFYLLQASLIPPSLRRIEEMESLGRAFYLYR